MWGGGFSVLMSVKSSKIFPKLQFLIGPWSSQLLHFLSNTSPAVDDRMLFMPIFRAWLKYSWKLSSYFIITFSSNEEASHTRIAFTLGILENFLFMGTVWDCPAAGTVKRWITGSWIFLGLGRISGSKYHISIQPIWHKKLRTDHV